jgi:DMSO/TMAO reductase YedYZ molybdopterin-dependent catalytic subunit
VKAPAVICLFLLLPLAVPVHAEGRIKVNRSTPAQQIYSMDPKDVDPGELPLTAVESLHSTGSSQTVNLAAWRLTVSGPGVKASLSLSYEDLLRMPATKKRVILICPGFFYDYLEWEGVPLSLLLDRAGVVDYSEVSFTSVDGYSGSFTRQEVEEHLILVATRGNGVPLPRAHGFPARVVAEDISGGRWVKYLKEIAIK